MYYILDGHKIVPCDDVLKWAKWLEKAERHVADDKENGIRVSTIFLGIDHSFGQEPPLLFETMVFGGEHDEDMERYSTWEEAEQGHKKMCGTVFVKGRFSILNWICRVWNEI